MQKLMEIAGKMRMKTFRWAVLPFFKKNYECSKITATKTLSAAKNAKNFCRYAQAINTNGSLNLEQGQQLPALIPC